MGVHLRRCGEEGRVLSRHPEGCHQAPKPVPAPRAASAACGTPPSSRVIPIRLANALAAAPRGRVARLGDALGRHRRVVQAVQWAVVLFYTVLVVVPALLPLPPVGASVLNDLTLFAQFVFWGVWWPGVIAATVLLGRSWCGLFCPEGSLSEFASRHGLGRSIPRWMRWRGWPTVAFVITTVYGQLISVYEYPRAALLVLGGSTVAAVAVGLVWGRGKRVWCRHLCPVSGVFALLVQLAPLHFRADDGAWRRHAGPAPAVDCAPLLPLPAQQPATPAAAAAATVAPFRSPCGRRMPRSCRPGRRPKPRPCCWCSGCWGSRAGPSSGRCLRCS
jgi:hypothetical protein